MTQAQEIAALEKASGKTGFQARAGNYSLYEKDAFGQDIRVLVAWFHQGQIHWANHTSGEHFVTPAP